MAKLPSLGEKIKNLEKLISSEEEPHSPPLTAGLSAFSLSLSLSLSKGPSALEQGAPLGFGEGLPPCADGSIAQWLERLTADQQVPGSSPGWPFTRFARGAADV